MYIDIIMFLHINNLKVKILKYNKTTKDIDIASLLSYGGHF